MNILLTLLVTFFAGMGAGLGTGFAGMSAAAVISPMLITFLGMVPYMAVGIALSSDVLASAVSAYTYGKNKKQGYAKDTEPCNRNHTGAAWNRSHVVFSDSIRRCIQLNYLKYSGKDCFIISIFSVYLVI